MLKGYKRRANIAAAIWFTSMGMLIYLITSDPEIDNIWENGNFIAQVTIIVNFIAWFFALWAYVKAKGRSGAWAMLGVFQLIGLIVIAILEDKHPNMD